jgi:hypothetical protein
MSLATQSLRPIPELAASTGTPQTKTRTPNRHPTGFERSGKLVSATPDNPSMEGVGEARVAVDVFHGRADEVRNRP